MERNFFWLRYLNGQFISASQFLQKRTQNQVSADCIRRSLQIFQNEFQQIWAKSNTTFIEEENYMRVYTLENFK